MARYMRSTRHRRRYALTASHAGMALVSNTLVSNVIRKLGPQTRNMRSRTGCVPASAHVNEPLIDVSAIPTNLGQAFDLAMLDNLIVSRQHKGSCGLYLAPDARFRIITVCQHQGAFDDSAAYVIPHGDLSLMAVGIEPKVSQVATPKVIDCLHRPGNDRLGDVSCCLQQPANFGQTAGVNSVNLRE